jgi:hypothetical protein
VTAHQWLVVRGQCARQYRDVGIGADVPEGNGSIAGQAAPFGPGHGRTEIRSTKLFLAHLQEPVKRWIGIVNRGWHQLRIVVRSCGAGVWANFLAHVASVDPIAHLLPQFDRYGPT